MCFCRCNVERRLEKLMYDNVDNCGYNRSHVAVAANGQEFVYRPAFRTSGHLLLSREMHASCAVDALL